MLGINPDGMNITNEILIPVGSPVTAVLPRTQRVKPFNFPYMLVGSDGLNRFVDNYS